MEKETGKPEAPNGKAKDTSGVRKGKDKVKRSGEGWYIFTCKDNEYARSEGPFDTLKDAEAMFKVQAKTYDGMEVLILKVQRRTKVKVETVQTVSFS